VHLTASDIYTYFRPSECDRRVRLEVAGAFECIASRDVEHLVGLGIFERLGQAGRDTQYVLKGPKRGQTGHEGAGGIVTAADIDRLLAGEADR
jgi:hypothetical protein